MDLHGCAFKCWQIDFSPAKQNCIAFPAVMISKKNIYSMYTKLYLPQQGGPVLQVGLWSEHCYLTVDLHFHFEHYETYEKKRKKTNLSEPFKKAVIVKNTASAALKLVSIHFNVSWCLLETAGKVSFKAGVEGISPEDVEHHQNKNDQERNHQQEEDEQAVPEGVVWDKTGHV